MIIYHRSHLLRELGTAIDTGVIFVKTRHFTIRDITQNLPIHLHCLIPPPKKKRGHLMTPVWKQEANWKALAPLTNGSIQLRSCDEPVKSDVSSCPAIWLFPKIVGPPNHPFVHRVFPLFSPSILGFSHYFWKHIHIFTNLNERLSVERIPFTKLPLLRLIPSFPMRSRGSLLHPSGWVNFPKGLHISPHCQRYSNCRYTKGLI